MADQATIQTTVDLLFKAVFVLGGTFFGGKQLINRFSPAARARSNGNHVVTQITAAFVQSTNETKEAFYKALRELVVKRLDEQTTIMRDTNKMMGEFFAGERAKENAELKALLQRKGGSE